MVQNEQNASRGPGTLPAPAVDLTRVFDQIRPRIRRIVEEVLRDYALLDGSRPFTGAPSSTVPHAVGSTQLVRAIEFEAFTNVALFIIGLKQDADATLTALAALTTGANQFIYSTGADAFSMATVTAWARTLLDDANATAARATLGAAATSHAHQAREVEVIDPGWTGIFAGSGVRSVQEAIDHLDANIAAPP